MAPATHQLMRATRPHHQFEGAIPHQHLFLSLSFALLTAFAADGKSVSYKSGDENVQGVLYSPAGKGPFPALIVIHEWWGLNDWVKEQASKLADQGYVTLAIDLYRGKVATTPDMAHEIMRGVPDDRAARDLHAAVEFLQSQSDVKKINIGAIGWCMGGGYALNRACTSHPQSRRHQLRSPGHRSRADLPALMLRILGIFGGKDRGIPVDDVNKFAEPSKSRARKSKSKFIPMPATRSKIPTTKKAIARTMRPTRGSARSHFWPRSLRASQVRSINYRP